MQSRELLRKWPKVTAALASLLVLASIAYLIHTVRGRGTDLPVFPDKGYFTIDDGATWFVASDSNVAPFADQNGKEAVRANLFTCDGGSHVWVAYLEKYTPAAKAALEAMQAGKPLPTNTPGPITGKMVKRPGTGKWVVISNPASADVMTPKCPDGISGTPQPVLP